jgi:hypothetical protein
MPPLQQPSLTRQDHTAEGKAGQQKRAAFLDPTAEANKRRAKIAENTADE